MKEIWKPVPSKDGLKASSWGRVLLPQRTARMPHGGLRVYKTKPTYGTVMRAAKTARHTFRGLYNPKYGNMKVHRMVCEAFHGPSPFPRAVVIHLDEDAHNNRPENLKWGTQKENLNMPGYIAYLKSPERAAKLKSARRRSREKGKHNEQQ